MNIAISGKMCSGKTTLAKTISDKFNYTILSFATPMKRLVKDMQMPLCERVARVYGDCIHWWGEELGYGVAAWIVHTFLEPGVPFVFNGKDDQGRKILQILGHKGRQLFGKDLWLKPMEKDMQEHKFVIIDDVRYPNELKFCEDNGFFTLRLEVPEKERLKRVQQKYGEISEERLNHPTETLLDSANFNRVYHWSGETPEQIIKDIEEGRY